MRKKGGPEFECLCSHLLKREGQILDNFKKFLSIKVIKIVLDSMVLNIVWYVVWTIVLSFSFLMLSC